MTGHNDRRRFGSPNDSEHLVAKKKNTTQAAPQSDAKYRVTKWLFKTQLWLIGGILLLMIIGYTVEKMVSAENSFGFFWFAFLSGCLGGSLALQRHIGRALDRGE